MCTFQSIATASFGAYAHSNCFALQMIDRGMLNLFRTTLYSVAEIVFKTNGPQAPQKCWHSANGRKEALTWVLTFSYFYDILEVRTRDK